MRRAIATLAALALMGTWAVDVTAQKLPAGVISIAGDTRQKPDSPGCEELGQLREELARLHQELRQLEAALAQAKHGGNRERAQQIAQEIRRVQSHIQDVQHRLRRLEQICRG